MGIKQNNLWVDKQYKLKINLTLFQRIRNT